MGFALVKSPVALRFFVHRTMLWGTLDKNRSSESNNICSPGIIAAVLALFKVLILYY